MICKLVPLAAAWCTRWLLCTFDVHLLPRSTGRGSYPCGASYLLPRSTSLWYYPRGASGLLPRSTGRWSYPCGPSCAANCRCPGLAAEWRRDGQHMGTVAQRGPFFPAGGSEEARLSTRPVHAMRIVALARSSSFLFDSCTPFGVKRRFECLIYTGIPFVLRSVHQRLHKAKYEWQQFLYIHPWSLCGMLILGPGSVGITGLELRNPFALVQTVELLCGRLRW